MSYSSIGSKLRVSVIVNSDVLDLASKGVIAFAAFLS
jgi:hypothetical protein